MSGGYLFGWDSDANEWVKVECNPDGELLIDPTMLLENPPTEDEALKAPTSEWAFDHNANVAAHHVKYTDVDSRAAISDLLDSNGAIIRTFNANFKTITQVGYLRMKERSNSLHNGLMFLNSNTPSYRVWASHATEGYKDCTWELYKTDHYVFVIDEDNLQQFLALYLENPPIEDSVNTAPTSEWAFDHDADANAHHTKFTALEAQQACNLDGNIYHTIPGTSFQGTRPNVTDAHFDTDFALESWSTPNSFFCSVILPHGATVTAVLVDGNAGASSQMWIMYRVAMSNQAQTFMANALITNEDTSIDNPIIDNELYVYGIKAIDLSTNDKIFYARIKYTL